MARARTLVTPNLSAEACFSYLVAVVVVLFPAL